MKDKIYLTALIALSAVLITVTTFSLERSSPRSFLRQTKKVLAAAATPTPLPAPSIDNCVFGDTYSVIISWSLPNVTEAQISDVNNPNVFENNINIKRILGGNSTKAPEGFVTPTPNPRRMSPITEFDTGKTYYAKVIYNSTPSEITAITQTACPTLTPSPTPTPRAFLQLRGGDVHTNK